MLNPFKDVNWNPGLVEKRKFGMSLIIGFPCLALFFMVVTWLRTHTWQPGFMWIGAIGLALGAVLWLLPQIARPFYLAWYFVACCIGMVVGNTLLSVFYFLV